MSCGKSVPNGPPPEAFIISDESSSPGADDYLIDAEYSMETHLLKIQPRAKR